MLRRLSDRRVVLVFDGDEAGRSAADRALELFLASEVDLRVLTLPAGLDPCDYLLKEGADAFRQLAEQAPEALAYLVNRAVGSLRPRLDRRISPSGRVGVRHREPGAPDASSGTRSQEGQGPRHAVASAPDSARDTQ